MNSKSLMQYLQKRAADTSDTSAVSVPYQRKAPIHAGCTPDTADTSYFAEARENVQPEQFGEAVNDPQAPELKSQPSPQPPDLVQHPAPAADKPGKPRKLKFVEWQEGWRDLDLAYQAHHWSCPTCIAASRGYGLRCGAGAALYRAHSDASADRSGLDW